MGHWQWAVGGRSVNGQSMINGSVVRSFSGQFCCSLVGWSVFHRSVFGWAVFGWSVFGRSVFDLSVFGGQCLVGQ